MYLLRFSSKVMINFLEKIKLLVLFGIDLDNNEFFFLKSTFTSQYIYILEKSFYNN